MHIVSPKVITYNIDTLEAEFSETPLDESLTLTDLDCNYVIDINGVVYLIQPHKQTAKIIIIGGAERFVHDKIPSVSASGDGNFFVTDNQRRTLTIIMKDIAATSRYCLINSTNETLQGVLQAMKHNYGGRE